MTIACAGLILPLKFLSCRKQSLPIVSQSFQDLPIRENKSDRIYEGRVFDPQCLCWESVRLNIWRSCVQSTLLCCSVSLLEKVKLNIWTLCVWSTMLLWFLQRRRVVILAQYHVRHMVIHDNHWQEE